MKKKKKLKKKNKLKMLNSLKLILDLMVLYLFKTIPKNSYQMDFRDSIPKMKIKKFLMNLLEPLVISKILMQV